MWLVHGINFVSKIAKINLKIAFFQINSSSCLLIMTLLFVSQSSVGGVCTSSRTTYTDNAPVGASNGSDRSTCECLDSNGVAVFWEIAPYVLDLGDWMSLSTGDSEICRLDTSKPNRPYICDDLANDTIAGLTYIRRNLSGGDFFSCTTDATNGHFVASEINVKWPQTILFNAISTKNLANPTFTLSASGGGSGNPVTFAVTGACSLGGASNDELTVTAVGSCTVTASLAGDTEYLDATDVARTFAIVKANQTIDFDALTDKVFADPSFTVNATGGGSSNPVTFTASGSCTASGANGTSITILATGSCAITAHQAGNSIYEDAADVPQSFTIAKADQVITFADPADQTFVSGATFMAPATSDSGLPVTVASSTMSVCTVAGNTVSIVTAGNCDLTASQAGDGNYNAAANANNTVVIAKADQIITFADPMDQTFAPGATFMAPASSDSSLPVTVLSNTPSVCTIAGNTVSIVSAGGCDLTASQAGDGNYNAAVDVDNTVVIGKADQTITFDGLVDKTFGDPPFMVNATSDSNLTVSFTAMGSCTVAGNTVTLTNGGSCTITAAQAGDDNYNAATDVAQSFNIGDNDGIPDAIEDAAPNGGDGNNDGTPDSEQTEVSSLVNITGDYITMAVSGGCAEIQNPAAVNPPAPDQIYTYPLGLLSFSLPCETATVKVFYHGTAELNGYNYRKYGPIPPSFDVPQWYVFADTVFASEMIAANPVATATYDLVDAQLGDDTGDDGLIIEPGGPGLPFTEAIPTLNQWSLLGLSVLLGLIGMGRMQQLKQRRQV